MMPLAHQPTSWYDAAPCRTHRQFSGQVNTEEKIPIHPRKDSLAM